MHLLSLVQWNHFAYMVISVALLGFGASGSLLALTKKWFTRHIDHALIILMLLTGISMCGVLIFSSVIFGRFDTFRLFTGVLYVYYLFLIYFVFFIPFFSGGLALGLIYIFYIKRTGVLYFADMTGAGAGGLAMIGLFWLISPAQLPVVISFLPIIGGFLIIPGYLFRRYLVPLILSSVLPVFLILLPPGLPVSEYKSLSKTLNIPGSKIIIERKSPYGVIQVSECPSLRYAPGLSLSYTGNIPVRNAIFNNSNWFGPVIEWTKKDDSHFLDFTTQNLPYLISDPETVLILDAGTGLNATHALSHGASQVTVVEQNTVAINLLKNELAGMIDSLFSNPEINYVKIHSRSYLLSDTTTYDLIVLPTIESFGGSAGVNALKEQYIFTLEAMKEIWDRTTNNGIIAVTSWMDYPVRNPLKILATLAETFKQHNRSAIEDHLAVIRNWGTISFILKKSPFTSYEIERIKEFCNEMYFDPVLLPGLNKAERVVYNRLQDDTFFNLFDRIITKDHENIYESYDFNINPATDNKPYFSQFLKISRIGNLLKTFGEETVPFLELGYFIVLLTLIQISIAAIILIIIPLFFTQWEGGGKIYTLLYFSGIGIGFMFMEIILIQQFILYFGNPIYAASAVLSGMLIFAGLGSLFSSLLIKSDRNVINILVIVILLIFLYKFLLTPVLKSSINYPLLLKVFFSLLIIAPVAFFMGMPFPLGLKYLSERNNSLMPWAWGINGCFSVISTVLATIIAVEAGYAWVMIIAGIAYILALIAKKFT